MGYASLKLFDKGDTAYYGILHAQVHPVVPAILTMNERYFGRIRNSMSLAC